MANSIYKRLTGKRRGFAGFSQLWMGPDHLLLVRSSRITEHYQRFSFSDIQSVVVTATPDRTVLQVLGVLTALAWGALALAMDSRFAKGFFLVTGALLVALAVIDIARGPRCRCTLYTAVSQEPLSPVSRLRIARQFLSVLTPAVESVQGSLAPERAGQLPVSSPELAAAPPRLVKSSHRAAWILFALLLLDSVLMWTGFHYVLAGGDELILTAYSAEILLALMVLIQDRDHPLRMVYLLAGAAMVCVGADAWATLPDIGRRLFLQAIQSPQAAIVHYPNRVVYFALAWRVIGGLTGIAALLLARPRKPVQPAQEVAPS